MKIEFAESKTAAEILPYGLVMSHELKTRGPDGEDDAITSVQWTPPAGMQVVAPFYSDFYFGAWLSGGSVGKNYVDVVVTTRYSLYAFRLVVTVKNN